MMYVVARVITSPTGTVRAARLAVTDVPAGVSLGDVLEALTAAGRESEFSEAGVPFGNHEVRRDGVKGWPFGITGIDRAPAVTWAELTRPATRAEGKRMTLRLTPAEWSAFNLAARREGVSLQTWAVEALAAAAEAASPAEAAAP